MSYVISRGIRVFYEVLGSGPTLVLQHGLMQSTGRWHLDGYVDALQGQFRLILIDACGHGRSDKPYDPSAYTLDKLAGDVVAVMDALELEQAHYWGFSLGAAIGFALAELAPQRVSAFVLGGNHPYGRSLPAEFRLDGSDPDEFAKRFLQRIGVDPASIPPQYRELMMANDFRAIAAAAQDRPSLGDILPAMAMPCLVYAGDVDPVYAQAEEAARHMPNARFVTLAGLDHSSSFRESGQVLPHVLPFLQALGPR